LKSWEGLLLAIFVVVVALNITLAPDYLAVGNQINLFQLSIEKIIVALAMSFIIINGEIDLSVASVMGLAAAVLAFFHDRGAPFGVAIVAALLSGTLAGAINGAWIAYGRLPSLAVTLAGLIGYRGVARILIEDRSITGFPAWFNALGQGAVIGPFPIALILFAVLFLVAATILHGSAFGRYLYVIGNSREVARYSGVRVPRIKLALFIISGTVAALAGILLAARLGAVRGNTADGFELDIITMVLLGGASIFGGSGSLAGIGLAILIILNLRNGMGLLNLSGNTQTGVIGVLLILSVLAPNISTALGEALQRRRLRATV
jgi:rhamnose transport system permease protein